MSDEVDNQYRLALEDALPALRGYASTCSFAYYEGRGNIPTASLQHARSLTRR